MAACSPTRGGAGTVADGTTPNLGLKLIEVGGSRDNWGQKINDNMTEVDTAVKGVRDTANGALQRAGGTVTGEVRRDGQGALIHWTDDAMDR